MATAKFLDIQVLNYAIKALSKQIDKTFLKKNVLFDVTPAYYRMFDSLTDDASKMLTVVDNNVTPSTGEIKSDDVRTVTKTPTSVYAVGSQIIYIEEVLTPKYDNVIGISETDLTTIKNDTTQNRQDKYKSNILFVVDDNKLVFYDRDLDTFTDCTSGVSDTTPEWESNKLYKVDDLVKYNNYTYKCIAEHTSTTVFEDDIDNWILVVKEYYVLKQAQYDKLKNDGIINNDTKELYIVTDTTDNDINNKYIIHVVDTLPTPDVNIKDFVYFLQTDNKLYKCIEDADNLGTYIMKELTTSGSSDVTIGYDFTSNIAVGAYPKGTVFTSDMLLNDIIKGAFITYLQPNVTFTPTSNKTFEIGTNYTGEELKAVITKQSNNIVSVKFYENTTELYSDTSTATNGGTVTYTYSTSNNDTNFKLKCVVDDGQSPVTIERSINFVRKGFYGTSSSSTTPVATSADVRALSNSFLSPSSGSNFTINIPSGATLVTIAVPSTRTLKSVIYVEGMNSDVKDTFVLSTVNVEGANNYTGIDYTVYSYIPAIPFPNNATYKVTLN